METIVGETVILSENALNSLARQLYKYYDLPCENVIRVESFGPRWPRCYRITYETERGFRWDIVEMTVHRDCIEDLYIKSRVDGRKIYPTTTLQEQEERL
jgi:hypothetical protein